MANRGSTTDRAPFPTDVNDFVNDQRISFDRVTQTHKLEDENGEEWEWLERPQKWMAVTDEAMLAQQQSAYERPDQEESTEQTDQRKRKAGADGGNGTAQTTAKKQKSEQQRPAQKNKAVYVSSLPHDITEDELHTTFSKFGVIAESADDNKPRIKLYKDDEGNFKGDALIVYFRAESVQLAINMLDETDFRMGEPVETGPMQVREADTSFKVQKEQPLAGAEAKTRGTGANRDRQKVIKKNEEMNSRLADWDDGEPSALPDTSNRWDKVVILKHMFTLQELADDPASLLEIKEDVREECEKFGEVTNVVLFDKEEDGVMTIRFSNAIAAKACVQNFDGRWFDRRQVVAYVAERREKFKKSRKQDEDEDEEQRLEAYGRFLDEGQD